MGVTCVTGKVGLAIFEMLEFVKLFALNNITVVISLLSAPQQQEFCTNEAFW